MAAGDQETVDMPPRTAILHAGADRRPGWPCADSTTFAAISTTKHLPGQGKNVTFIKIVTPASAHVSACGTGNSGKSN